MRLGLRNRAAIVRSQVSQRLVRSFRRVLILWPGCNSSRVGLVRRCRELLVPASRRRVNRCTTVVRDRERQLRARRVRVSRVVVAMVVEVVTVEGCVRACVDRAVREAPVGHLP